MPHTKKSADSIKTLYAYAKKLQKNGMTDKEIKVSLIKKGIKEEEALKIISNLDNVVSKKEDTTKLRKYLIIWGIVMIVVIGIAIYTQFGDKL